MYPIIDAHVHIMPQTRIAGLMRWIKRAFPDHPVDPDIDEEGIVSELSDRHIPLFFNYVYPLKPEETDQINEFNRLLPHRLPQAAPFGSLHLDTPEKEAVTRRCIEDHRFVGLKFHPFVQRFDPADERMFVVYEMMEAYGKPVVLHTGFEDFYRMKMPPADIERILRRFPNLVLVLSHCLFPHFREVRTMMEQYRGVWLDATNVFGVLKYLKQAGGAIGGLDYSETGDLFRGLVADFTGRTLFGSDHPVGMGDLKTIYDDFAAFGLPDGVSRAVLWENPLAFVGRFAPDIRDRWDAVLGRETYFREATS